MYRDYTIDEFEHLWIGNVNVDDSLDDYVNDISYSGDAKLLKIKDVKYHHEDYFIPDYPETQYRIPVPITIVVKGKELLDQMKCTAFRGYYKIAKTKGLIRKETYYEKRFGAKGFILEPLPLTNDGKPATDLSANATKLPRLMAYRANIGGDNTFSIVNYGAVFFHSASASAYLTDPARRSVTALFIATNDNPMIANVRKKGQIHRLVCSGYGTNEESQDKGAKPAKTKKTKDDPLQVLKLRLAKGEITKEQYDELRQLIESG